MKNSIYLVLIVLLSIAIGFLLGKNDLIPLPTHTQKGGSLKKLNTLVKYLSNDYVDKVNTDSLVNGVIEGIVSQLDPHSQYIPASQRQQMEESMQGNYVGIGVSFYMIEDSIAVVRTLEGGASKKAGILPGDRILMADEDTLYQKNLLSEDVVFRLKGMPNTDVALKIHRQSNDSVYHFKIRRGKVPLPSVSTYYMMNEGMGYLKLNRFSQTTYDEFVAAIKVLKAQGMEDLILDLRDNPGGYLFPAEQIADDFLPEGAAIVTVKSNNGKRNQTKATSGGIFENGALYILVNEQSASASEVLAGALQDNDRAWIVGRRTFGKGLVQQQMPLGGGDVLRLTTARYYTPTGRSIQKPYEGNERDAYFSELQARYDSGEMGDSEKVAVADSLAFKTPKGRTVYGGGGIIPDVYVPNPNSAEEEWNDFLIGSNLMNRFVFLELDKDRAKYSFSDPDTFFENPLPDSEALFEAFTIYCQDNQLPINTDKKDKVLTSIKAYMALQLFGEAIFNRILNTEDVFIETILAEVGRAFEK